MRGSRTFTAVTLRTTRGRWADEIASAASLVMGRAPRARRSCSFAALLVTDGEGKAADLVRPRAQDLFR